MKIALYKSAPGGLLDKTIDAFSGRLGFSHVEFVFSDGLFFSSSGLDGGVRFKRINLNPEHWRFYEMPVSSEEEYSLRLWCKTKVGKKYDWLGVLGFLPSFPTTRDQGRWFCSEIVTAGLHRIGRLCHVIPWRTSPNELFLILEAVGFVPTPGALEVPRYA